MTDSDAGQLPAAGRADRLHLSPRHRETLEALLREHLPGIEVWAYGSRVNGESHDGSDLDLVLRAPDLQEVPMGPLADFTEALHDFTLPFLVEARDWARLPERFHREIERGYVVVIEKENQSAGSEWRDMPFSEAVQINPRVRLERGETYPYVDMASVNANYRSVLAPTRRKYSGGGSRFQCGDTLMARITPCLENGKIACFVPSTLGSNTPAYGSTEFIIIRGRTNTTLTDFVYYLTRWDGVRNYAIDQMTGTSGRQRVPTSCFDHLLVPIPPLPEQRAIAHILGTLDDKIELNRRMNQTLEAMARALFKSWFVDFEPVRAKMEGRWRPGESLPGLPAHLYDLFPDRLVDSDLGEVPEGWEVKALDEIAIFRNGLALQKHRPQEKEEWLPVVKIAQLRSGKADSEEKATAHIPPECIINDGDVIFSWSGSLMVKIWYGGRAALNQHLFKVTSTKFPKWFFLLCVLSHLPDFQTIAAGKATTMGHIKRHHLSEAICAVPDSQLLTAADDFMTPLLEKGISAGIQSRTLVSLRDALLPKLISGKLLIKKAEKFITRDI